MNKCLICDELVGTENKRKFYCEKCKFSTFTLTCDGCGKSTKNVNAYKYVASKTNGGYKSCMKCCPKYTGSMTGEKNPSFGKKWSEEKKKRQSELIKSKVDEKYRQDCSKGRKGKKIPEEQLLRKKITEERKRKNGYKIFYSDEARKNMGEASAKRYTAEYKQYIREIREKNGSCIKLEDKDDYLFYRDLSNWKGQILSDHVNGIEKLSLFPFYSKKTRSSSSLVRDHMYSRRMGFKELVFPEIVRHPANCQIISHGENFDKGKRNNDCIISIDELIERIELWTVNYEEQNQCLILIENFRDGLRYSKQKYIKTLYD